MSKQQRGLGKGLGALLGGDADLSQIRKPVGYVNKEVVSTESHSQQGTADILRIPMDMIEPNPDLTIEGFLVTMFDGRTKVHNQVLGELREHFGDMVFDTIIQRNIRLSEAPSHGKPIILYDVICNGTTNYLNLAKEVLEKNS